MGGKVPSLPLIGKVSFDSLISGAIWKLDISITCVLFSIHTWKSPDGASGVLISVRCLHLSGHHILPNSQQSDGPGPVTKHAKPADNSTRDEKTRCTSGRAMEL